MLEIIKQYINIIIPTVIVAVIQVIKVLLANQGIKPKNSDFWVWIALVMGLPMAIIGQGLKGFTNVNWYNFVLSIFAYAAGAAFIYKFGKVGKKTIEQIFKKREDVFTFNYIQYYSGFPREDRILFDNNTYPKIIFRTCGIISIGDMESYGTWMPNV
jgi:hypothetical protein